MRFRNVFVSRDALRVFELRLTLRRRKSVRKWLGYAAGRPAFPSSTFAGELPVSNAAPSVRSVSPTAWVAQNLSWVSVFAFRRRAFIPCTSARSKFWAPWVSVGNQARAYVCSSIEPSGRKCILLIILLFLSLWGGLHPTNIHSRLRAW